jgi:elongation factor P
MAILSYNEILPKKIIDHQGEPYEVLSSWVFRKQMRKPVNQTKLRHLISGKVIEISFHQNETVAEADVSAETIIYLYSNRGESWFHKVGNPSERFSMKSEPLADKIKWLREKQEVEAVLVDDEVVSINIPVKVDLKVVEAPPSVKGDTATGGTKQVTLESGAVVNTPLFINTGDVVRINTETGTYYERVEKN